MTKRNKIIYWIATIWLSLGMVSTGIVQLTKGKAGAAAADSVVHLGYPTYLLPMLAVCKFLGVVAILIPKFVLVKEWAYAGFFFMMAGAVISHMAIGDSANEIFPALLLLALSLLSWYFRPADRKISAVNQ